MENTAYKTDFDTIKTIKNIRKNLLNRLKKTYKLTPEEQKIVLERILEIHGLSIKNFDIISYTSNAILSKLNMNEMSSDDNANKSINTVSRVISEGNNSNNKLVGYDFLYRSIKKMYGREEAVRLSALMYDYTLGIHDSTKILVPYCWALNGSVIIGFGRNRGDSVCAPAKHLHSYISQLCGLIHTLSNSSLAGAIAIGTFFIDSAATIIMDGYRLNDILTNKTSKDTNGGIRKYIENMFQQFIYDVQDKTRGGVESPFTNVSIFDRTKLSRLLEDSWWMFEDQDIEKDEVIEIIIEIQDIYMDLFDKGNPELNGLQFTFPVSTINFSIDNKEDRNLTDIKYLNQICKHKIKRYNLFVSEGSKVASCCRLLNDTEFLENASQSNSFGAGATGNLGSHRVVTPDLPRIAYMSKNLHDFKKRMMGYINDSVKILKSHLQLLHDLTNIGLQPDISNGTIILERMFSTLGLVGLYETKLILESKEKDSKNKDIMADFLKFINWYFIRQGLSAGLRPNLEEIPGESMCVRMCEITNMLLKKDDFKMYSNQFIPLWVEKSMWERINEDGKYNRLLTGGGIVHCQVDSDITEEQTKKIIKKLAKSGCEHIAINSVTSICENGHIHEKFYELNCPICGGKIKDWMTRVVGFFTKVSNWNKVRKTWEFPKRKFLKVEE